MLSILTAMRVPGRGLASSPTVARTRWPAAVFASLLTLLLTWAIATPRYGAPDELAHTIKAYATAHGQLLGSTTPGTSSLVRTFNVPRGLVSAEPWCFASFPEANAGCAVPTNDNSIVSAESSAATYPIPYYAVVGTAARAIGASDSARAYRLISIGLSTLALTAALVLVRRSFGSHAAVALLALDPMAVFVMSSVNPAALEVSGMLVLWAFLGRILTRDDAASRNDLLIASSIGAALVVMRPVSFPWVMIAFAGFFILEWRPLSIPREQRIRGLAVAGIPITLSVVASALWSRFAGVGLTDDKIIVEAPTLDIARVAIGRTALLFRQGFGTLGWLDTQLPSGIYGMWIAVIVSAASAVIFFGCWVAYPAAYATLARTPAVWQGRYNLPLLGGTAICTLVAVTRDQPGAHARQLARLCAGAFIIVEVVALHQTLRRFMVGASGDILLRSAGWSPRVDPWLLLIVNLAAASALAAMMLSAPPVGATGLMSFRGERLESDRREPQRESN
jgi:hypothetical protein